MDAFLLVAATGRVEGGPGRSRTRVRAVGPRGGPNFKLAWTQASGGAAGALQ
jgi:hypothetical protein